MSLRRTIAAVSLSAFALAGLAACGEEENGRETAAPPATSAQEAAIPTAEDLSLLLEQASDPAVPVEQKVNLVEGGAEAPEIFDQIAALKAEKGATVVITGVAEGDIPGTLIANAVNWNGTDERVDWAYDDAVKRYDREHLHAVDEAVDLKGPLKIRLRFVALSCLDQ